MKRGNVNTYEDYLRIQRRRVDDKRKTYIAMGARRDQFASIIASAFGHMDRVPQMMCCMGVKDGAEVLLLEQLYPGTKVSGVDIHPIVKERRHPRLYQYDFNHLPDDWDGAFDFIFSNSLDHSYRVEDTILEWLRVLSDDGNLLLVLSTAEPSDPADIYKFNKRDIDTLRGYGNITHVWDEKNQHSGFNIMMKKL